MICDITNLLEANPGPVFSMHKFECDTENRLYSQVGDILYPAGKRVEMKNIFIFIHSRILNEEMKEFGNYTS